MPALDAANPFATPSPLPFGLPPFADIRVEHYRPAFEAGVAEHLVEIDAIASDPEPPTFANTVEALERSDWPSIAAMLAETARVLHEAGADFAVLPDNVAHHALPMIESTSPIPWLNMIDLVAESIVANGCKQVGLIGTKYVTYGSTYQTVLGRVVWESGGDPMPAAGTMVSGHFFSLLGTPPAVGRTLEPADDRPGAALVVVLSDALARRAFGRGPDALGKTVRLDGQAHTVVGVMPPEFDFPRTAGFWRAVEPAIDSLVENRQIGFLSAVFEKAAFRVSAKGGEKAARAIATAARDAHALPATRLATTTAEPAGAFATVEILSLP